MQYRERERVYIEGASSRCLKAPPTVHIALRIHTAAILDYVTTSKQNKKHTAQFNHLRTMYYYVLFTFKVDHVIQNGGPLTLCNITVGQLVPLTFYGFLKPGPEVK